MASAFPDSTVTMVSVIIVNYNGLRFLEPCLRSLRSAFVGYPFEVVVVDNASTDGGREWLRTCPDIIYLALPRNLGFAEGNNLGARLASGERLLFINNDTVVNSLLDPLIDRLEDPGLGIAGCRLLYGDGRQQFSFGYHHTPTRLLLSWLGMEKLHSLPKVFRRHETDGAKYLRPHERVDWVSGACFAVRRQVWEQVGGFDERFFMYCEDVDLCLRVRQAGFRIGYSADVTVTHFEGAGRPWIGVAALRRTTRSYLLYLRKHYGAVATLVVSVLLGLIFMSRAIAFGLTAIVPGETREVRQEKARGFRDVAWSLMTSFGRSGLDFVQR